MRMPFIAAAILLAACSGGGSGGNTATVQDSAGIRITQSDSRSPAWSREQRWTLAANPRLQVGNVLGDPTQQLYQVQHSRRLRNGNLAVASSGLGEVRVFDSAGVHVRTIPVGDPVDSAPIRVWELPGDSLLVYQSNKVITVFDAAGGRVRSAPLASPGEELETELEPLGAFHDGSLLFRASFPRDSTLKGVGRRKIRLVRYATDGSLMGSFGDLDGQAVLYEDRGGYIFAPNAVAAPADSTVWYSTGDHYDLRELAADGRTLRIDRMTKPGVPVLQTDISAYRQAATNQVANTPRAQTIEATLQASVFADTFPVLDRVIVDDLGDVWVRNYQWFDLGSGKSWTVFDPEGRYLGEVGTPSILEIHQIGADFVIGRMSDGRGHEGVYTYDLIKPGAGPGGP